MHWQISTLDAQTSGGRAVDQASPASLFLCKKLLVDFNCVNKAEITELCFEINFCVF